MHPPLYLNINLEGWVPQLSSFTHCISKRLKSSCSPHVIYAYGSVHSNLKTLHRSFNMHAVSEYLGIEETSPVVDLTLEKMYYSPLRIGAPAQVVCVMFVSHHYQEATVPQHAICLPLPSTSCSAFRSISLGMTIRAMCPS